MRFAYPPYGTHVGRRFRLMPAWGSDHRFYLQRGQSTQRLSLQL
jgi:hypothetical protein